MFAYLFAGVPLPTLLWAAMMLCLGFVTWAARRASAHYVAAEASSKAVTHTARLAAIASAVATVAGNIIDMMASSPVGADAVATVRAAAVAQGVKYIQTHLPDYVAAVGVQPDTLAQMINGHLGQMAAHSPAAAATLWGAVAPGVAPGTTPPAGQFTLLSGAAAAAAAGTVLPMSAKPGPAA